MFYYQDNSDENVYYIDGNEERDTNKTYYKFTFTNDTAAQDDTKRLDMELPSIGNAISDVYDSIFGRPLNDPSVTGLKYTEEPVPDIFKDSIPNHPDNIDYVKVIINGYPYYIT
jgi:hypothetical protein